MSKNELNEVAFTNDIGQTIKPGDEVVIVTTCTGTTGTNRGTYVGRHKNGGVSCVKQVKTSYYVYKDSDMRVPYSDWTKLYQEQAEWREKNKPASLPSGQHWWNYYNEPEYKAIHNNFMEKMELKSEYVPRRTTLQLNRIFKLAA